MANISQVKLPNNSIYDIVPVVNPNNTVIDASVYVGPYPLNANSLCMVSVNDNRLYPFVQTAGTGNSTTYNIIPATVKFRIGTDILIAGKAYDGSAGAIDVSTLAISKQVDIRYSSRRMTTAAGTSYSTITTGKHNEIYMYVQVQPEAGTFNVICQYMNGYGVSGDYIVNILSKENLKSNTFCMFLGYSSKYDNCYDVWISPEHPLYYCDAERNLIPYDTWRNNIQDTSIGIIDTSINIIDGSITNIENTINNLPAPDASLYINKIVDGSIKIDAYPLNENSLCAFTTDNLLCAFVQDATTGTASIVPNTKKFRLGCDILIAGSDYSAGQSAGNVYTLKVSDKVDLRYSETTHTAGTNSSNNTHREMFMPIDISTLNGTFTLKTITKSSNPYNFIQKRSLVSNNFYMYMGYIAAAATSYSFWLDTNHPVYWYNGTNLIPYNVWKDNIQDTSINIINSSISLIDTSISNLSAGSIYFAKSNSNSTTSAITATVPEITATEYYEGLKIALYYTLESASTTSATLNINNLGGKRIYKKGSTGMGTGLQVNSINYLCYVGTASDGYFILDRDLDEDTDTLTYKNPVAGYNVDGNNLVPVDLRFGAAEIIRAQLAFEGTDGSIYSILNSDVSVNPDWGLAYWNSPRGATTLGVNNVIQQESFLLADTSIKIASAGAHVSSEIFYSPAYAWFNWANATIKTTQDSSVLHLNVPPISDVSNNTYIYVGTVEFVNNVAKYLHMDLSDHDYITLGTLSTGKGRPILAINGRPIGGGAITGGNYNNPVSGAGSNPPAAVDIDCYDLVCFDFNQNGLVPLKKYLSGDISQSGIVYDWGLAFCVEDVSQGQTPSEGSLLQQTTFTTTTSTGKPLPIFAFFDSDGMPLEGGGTAPAIVDAPPGKVSPYAPLAPNNKQLTTIYIGLWEGDSFHVDLSNHDFITYYYPVPEGVSPEVTGNIDSTYSVSHINGRPLAGSGGGSNSNGQSYGACLDHTGGGTPQEILDDLNTRSESDRYIYEPSTGRFIDTSTGETVTDPSTGEPLRSTPWTGIVTANSNFSLISGAIISVYFPTGQKPERGSYLSVNNTTAYPILFKGDELSTGDIAVGTVACFMYLNDSTYGFSYNLISGAHEGDYELLANKTYTLSASSTNSQYPSAKCMYDIIGNIEAALQAI